MASVIQILVNAEAAKAIAELQAVKGEIASVGKTSKVTGSSASGMGRAMKAGTVVAAGGLGILALGLKKSVDAAEDSERVQAKLKTALDNAGISYEKHADHIDKVITATSKLSGLDDEELTESFANMIRSTGNVNKALKLNAIAADLARTKGQSLATAQSLIARVYNGSFTGLKRLGVAFTPVTTAQDKLTDSGKKYTRQQMAAAKAADFATNRQAAIAALQKNFAGQAEAYGKTAAGAEDRIGVSVENLEESIGKGLLPVVTNFLNTLSGWVDIASENERVTKDVAVAMGILAAAFLTARVAASIANSALASFVKRMIITKNAETGLTGAQALLNAVMEANPIILIVSALVLLGIALVVAYKKSTTFRNIVNSAFHAVQAVAGAVVGFIRSHWQALLIFLGGPIGAVIVGIINHWDQLKSGVSSAVSKIKSIAEEMRSKISTVAGAIGRVLSPVVGAFNDVAGAVQGVIGKIQWLINNIPSIPTPDLGGLNPFGAIGHLSTPAGPMTVGEHGPEMVRFPAGARLTNAPNTRGYRRDWRNQGGGGDVTVIVQAGPLDSLASRRRVGATVATEVFRAMERSGR